MSALFSFASCCLSGHGGNGFLKFQDSEEISNVELADAFEQMWQKRRRVEEMGWGLVGDPSRGLSGTQTKPQSSARRPPNVSCFSL